MPERQGHRDSALPERAAPGSGWLLRDISLDLAPGERLAVTGPSGAGKSMLLRALAGLDPLDAGRILFQGEPLSRVSMPAYRAQVTYLHQRPALAEGSAEDNLRHVFRLRIHRNKAYDRRRIEQYLATLGRDPSFLDRPAAALSGGEQQLVALMRVLHLQPRVLLLDEPTASLDPEAAEAIETLVDAWMGEDTERAYIWVSHDAAQTKRVASRVLRMREGRLVEPSLNGDSAEPGASS